jgi:tenascin
MTRCPGDCNAPHGSCDFSSGKCICLEGYDGVMCQNRKCKNNCSGNGKCTHSGKCICDFNFVGEDCASKICKDDCNSKKSF